jgi:hypothetical protein
VIRIPDVVESAEKWAFWSFIILVVVIGGGAMLSAYVG